MTKIIYFQYEQLQNIKNVDSKQQETVLYNTNLIALIISAFISLYNRLNDFGIVEALDFINHLSHLYKCVTANNIVHEPNW